ncbi:MAG: DUF3108 domain-containing protein [Gammaproteobacteria bacterium]|nr:DUF3108 domain-containing protein [Gammaproteobacteria bacterium]
MIASTYRLCLLQVGIIIVTFLCTDAVRADNTPSVPAFSASYSVRYGVLRGEMSLVLRHRDTGYTYETSLRPRGLASWLRRGEIREVSSLVLEGVGVRPLDYVATDTIARPNRSTEYYFDRSAGRVTGQYKSQTVNVPIQANGHNRVSVHVAIMRALQSGTELSRVSVFDRGRWKDYEFEIVPDQSVETPSGRFDTVVVRYASPDKKKSWSLHCAGSLNYLPVVIVFREKGKVKSRAELSNYRIGN